MSSSASTEFGPAPQLTTPANCLHCGDPIAQAQLQPEAAEQFCCSGCRTVYHALQANGLGAFYEQAQAYRANGAGASGERGAQRPQAERATADYGHFDDPAFIEQQVRHRDGLCEIELYLEGLHCPACVWLVEKLPQLSAGVHSARLNFGDARLVLCWRPEQVALSELARLLDSLGYPPHPAGLGRSREQQRAVDRVLLTRIGVAGAVFGNVMLFSFALYSGAAQGMNLQTQQFFRWASFGLSVPSICWTALPFFRGAWHAILTRTAHMDLPISIGIVAALLSGSISTLTGHGEIYFDTITMLVFLLLLGRWLGARQHRAASAATDLLLALAPSNCRLVTETGTREVPTISVPVGGLVELRAGDRIGVDGQVVEGESDVDESWLTGESRPLRAKVGGRVAAGTINLTARLLVRATRTGRDTRLADLVRQVEVASQQRPPILLFADRMSGYFTAFVLALAAFSLWLWGLEAGAPHAIALLIVTCPCALGLATPMAASVALGRAARRGILIKGMRFIELLAKPGLIAFDKTGTLTEGKQVLVDFDGSIETAALIRAAERGSAHTIARVLDRDLPMSEVMTATDFEETPGGGVRALVRGRDVRVGNQAFVSSTCDVGPFAERTGAFIARGLSPLYVSVDGVLAACAGIGDAVRPEAADTLRDLATLGYRFAILSGDRQQIVDRVVAELGVPFETALGEQSPERKLQRIEDWRQQQVVLMVGDGVNDAAALAAASVGIAVQGGAEASLAAADVFATATGLVPVLELARGARRTLWVIRTNLLLSLAYNLTAAALSVAGLITPLVAAILMPLSSLTVLANSLRAKTFDGPQAHNRRNQ
jgi:P-type Cu2+ transporter